MTAVLEIQGRGRTAFCRPVQPFSQVARQVGMKDEDGLRFAVPSRPGLLAVPPPGPTGAPDDCEHWIRYIDIHARWSPPNEISIPKYHSVALLNLGLLSLLLALLFVLVCIILSYSIYLPTLEYHIFSFFYFQNHIV